MTIETQTNRAQYVGNGAARDFPVPFPVPLAEYLHLYLWAGGRQTEITGGFSVIGAGTSAVTVRLNQPLAAGTKLTILREVPLTQLMDLQNGGDFNAETLEGSADNLEMQIQQLREEVGRAIVAPESLGPNEITYEHMQGLADAAEEAAARAASAAKVATPAELEALAVNDKWVSPLLLAPYAIRKKSTATVNIYIRTDGNDNNDGLANTAAGAVKSWNGVFRVLSGKDAYRYSLVLRFGEGEFPGVTLYSPFYPAFAGASYLDVHGASATDPSLTRFTSDMNFYGGGMARLIDASVKGRVCVDYGSLLLATNLKIIGADTPADGLLAVRGGQIIMNLACEFSGAFTRGLYVQGGTIVSIGSNIPLIFSDNASFSSAFLFAGYRNFGGEIGLYTPIWNGSFTGKKWATENGGLIRGQTIAQLNAIPGTIDGTSNTGPFVLGGVREGAGNAFPSATGLSISSGWVATSDGWVALTATLGAGGSFSLAAKVAQNWATTGPVQTCIPVAKGQTVTLTGSSMTIQALVFYPAQGAA